MFRIFLLFGVSIILSGSTAKPYSDWDKHDPGEQQEVLKTGDLDVKMSVGLKEVEPPEDQGITDDDVDPYMLFFKVVKNSQERKYYKAEEDEDETYHTFPQDQVEKAVQQDRPSYMQGIDPLPEMYKEAEPDMDDIYHKSELGPSKLEREEAGLYASQVQEPEEDMDHLYHSSSLSDPRHDPPVKVEQPRYDTDYIYDKPEEDLDHIYHRA
ncbi:uncharacterized protein LOC136715725 [Amia ocellicauda]|uniref:uncharacterized protein LOC136715725 n=1 Tax=Amia ocellicauda TaxID=2972642 RepID=UPI0034641A10